MAIYPIELFTMNVLLQIVETVEKTDLTLSLSDVNEFQFENEMVLIDMIALKFYESSSQRERFDVLNGITFNSPGFSVTFCRISN